VAAVDENKDAEDVKATWLGAMDSAAGLHQTRIARSNISYSICDNCGLATQWVSQDGWPFNAALSKNNDAANPK
jgi:hypothetical protein